MSDALRLGFTISRPIECSKTDWFTYSPAFFWRCGAKKTHSVLYIFIPFFSSLLPPFFVFSVLLVYVSCMYFTYIQITCISETVVIYTSDIYTSFIRVACLSIVAYNHAFHTLKNTHKNAWFRRRSSPKVCTRILTISSKLFSPHTLNSAKLKCCSKTFQFRMLGCSFSDALILTPLSSS